MRYGICIVATVSCCRFEKNVGDFELKDLIIVLVGANFFSSHSRLPDRIRALRLAGTSASKLAEAHGASPFLVSGRRRFDRFLGIDCCGG
jgi:hypothetical protein